MLNRWSIPGLLSLFLMGACGNTPGSASVSPLDTNPAFAGINDSIRVDPKNPTLYLRRAARLAMANEYGLAYPDFKKAWSLQPGLETVIPFAASLQVLGRHAERLELLKTAESRFPDNPQLQRLLADAYTSAGDTGSALRQYAQILNRDSADFETWYEQGLLQEQLGDTLAALNSLQRAYSLKAVDDYGLELAHLYAEQKNPKSLEICNAILDRDSADQLIDPLFIKGIYYSNTKQYPKAFAQFDSCIRRDWKTTDAYIEKGIAYFRMQDYSSAQHTFTMATTVSNTDADAYFWLGRCAEAKNQKDDAMRYYREALALDKTLVEAKERMERLSR